VKISKHYLQRVIKEELSVLLKEQDAGQRFTAAYNAAAKTDASDDEVIKAANAAMVKFFKAQKGKMPVPEARKKAKEIHKKALGMVDAGKFKNVGEMSNWIESGGAAAADVPADVPATGGGEVASVGKIQPLIDKAMADNKEKIDALLDKNDSTRAMNIVRSAVFPIVLRTMPDANKDSVLRKIRSAMTNYVTTRSGKAETTTTEEPAVAAEKVHTVRPGESLTRVAKKYPGVKWRDIAKLNNIAGPRYITQPGQKLKIPGTGPAQTVATSKATVRKGRVAAPSGGPPRDLR
jgi:LysM repeat protein